MVKAKTETIILKKKDGAKSDGKITFKEGALRRQLKMKKGDTFTKAEMRRLKKIPIGQRFKFNGHDFKKTKLMSERIDLGLTLMDFKKRKKKK